MKKIIYTLVALAIIVVITVTFIFDSVGKKYAQEYATTLLKTPVSISQFSTSFLDKSLNIDFVEVQNPPTFKNKNALSLDHFSLEIGGDVFSDLIVVELLKFDGLKFVLEQSGSNVNLTQLLDNLKTQPPSSSSAPPRDTSAKRIKIKRFLVENIELKVDTQLLQTQINVPDISTSNFGGSAGVDVDEIGKQIVETVLKNLQKVLEEKGIEVGKKEIKKILIKKIGDKLGLDGITDKLGLDGVTDRLGFGVPSESTGAKDLLDTDKLKDQAKDLLKGFGF